MNSVVRAFVLDPEGKVLMVRQNKKTQWVMPGGHVENTETLHEAILRELQEELEIKADFIEIDTEEKLFHKGKSMDQVTLPISAYNLNYTDSKGCDCSRTEYVFLMTSDGKIGKVQVEEIDEYKWFDVEEILIMKPNIETWDFYQQILEKIFMSEDEEE